MKKKVIAFVVIASAIYGWMGGSAGHVAAGTVANATTTHLQQIEDATK